MNLANKLFVPQNKIEPSKPIVHYPGMSKNEEENVIRFFNALAPENPSAIDLPLIVDQGFPVFEKVLGPNKWTKLKKHYCIGFKRAVVLKTHDLNSLLSELRTIENAQFYLHGYRELLEKISKKLTNYPDGMDVVTKCKVLALYTIMIRNTYYFPDDCGIINQKVDINVILMKSNNKRILLPEELFSLYDYVLNSFLDENVLFDRIMEELELFDTRIRKELLSCFGLRYENNTLTSTTALKTCTYGTLRNIKYALFPTPEAINMDLFFYKDFQQNFDFSEIYQIYKSVQEKPYTAFPEEKFYRFYVSGSEVIKKEFSMYHCGDKLSISGDDELNRIRRFINYSIKHVLKTKVAFTIAGSKEEYEMTLIVPSFFAFLDFVHEVGYIDYSAEASLEFSMYLTFLSQENASEMLKKYISGDLSAKQLCKELNLDSVFKEDFDIESPCDPLEVIKDFALEQGYVENEECISDALVSAIIVDGNEELITNFAHGQITAEKLANKLKIESGLESMYFSLPAVDSLILENTLLDVKSSRSGDLTKHSLTVKLYCYLIDNQVKCGKKPRVIKGNKRLKLSNLKALAQIA